MALTKVILDGPLGKRFGREWNLAVSTPAEALQLIEANVPGFGAWINMNSDKYANYRVQITDQKGKKTSLDNDTFRLSRSRPSVIRFTPVTSGASAAVRIVVGVALIVVGVFYPVVMPAGIALVIGGLVEILSPQPKKPKDGSSEDNGSSYYFNGPVNTSEQGVPVPLVYGRCMIGSQAISANISVDQLMD